MNIGVAIRASFKELVSQLESLNGQSKDTKIHLVFPSFFLDILLSVIVVFGAYKTFVLARRARK